MTVTKLNVCYSERNMDTIVLYQKKGECSVWIGGQFKHLRVLSGDWLEWKMDRRTQAFFCNNAGTAQVAEPKKVKFSISLGTPRNHPELIWDKWKMMDGFTNELIPRLVKGLIFFQPTGKIKQRDFILIDIIYRQLLVNLNNLPFKTKEKPFSHHFKCL